MRFFHTKTEGIVELTTIAECRSVDSEGLFNVNARVIFAKKIKV